jgi:hypothetical protein
LSTDQITALVNNPNAASFSSTITSGLNSALTGVTSSSSSSSSSNSSSSNNSTTTTTKTATTHASAANFQSLSIISLLINTSLTFLIFKFK